MRPGCSENFRDSLTTPTATFPKILWTFVPTVPSERVLMSSYRPLAPHTQYSSISTRLPKILNCSFEWGLRTPNLGEGEAVGVGNGTVRKSVREFLEAAHSNFSYIFTRFRDIAAFVLQHATFSIPHLYSPPNFPMFPYE